MYFGYDGKITKAIMQEMQIQFHYSKILKYCTMLARTMQL